MAKSIDLDKLRSINYGGRHRSKSRVRQLTDDDSGRTTGFEIDHADGRQEAIVRPKAVVVTESLSTGEVRIS